MIAVVLAAAATLSVAKVAWGRRPTTEAYAKGAAGERRTAAVLAPLEKKGWALLHDRTVPGAAENIDHVAVGPPGVFVIETKNWDGGRAVIGRGTLTHKGRRKDKEIQQVRRQTVAVERALGTARMPLRRAVIPVLCIHGATVERRRWRTPTAVEGVEVCASRDLIRVLTHKRLAVLDHSAIAELADHLDSGLPPKTGSTPPPSRGRRPPNAHRRYT